MHKLGNRWRFQVSEFDIKEMEIRATSACNTMILRVIFLSKKTFMNLQQQGLGNYLANNFNAINQEIKFAAKSERGDVPGWVLVVLMTTGLVTGIWTVAQPRLSSILKNSLDNMNSIR